MSETQMKNDSGSAWYILGSALVGTAVGVGAVAAAPFTGGGSVLAAATLWSNF